MFSRTIAERSPRLQVIPVGRLANRAFTLIELLVVVAIIAILISILLPALSGARMQARESVCMSNMRQLAIGWVTYSNDWNGNLPGSARDVSATPGWSESERRTWCWLGTRTDFSGKSAIPWLRRFVPRAGAIYRYVGQQAAVYRCPEDMIGPQQVNAVTDVNSGSREMREKPPYSYTAPIILTGAPTSLMIRTRWAESFDSSFQYDRDWNKASAHSVPWMLTEEDEELALAGIYDSSWCNRDEVSVRHRGRSAVNHIDGSATMRKYQKQPVALDAWKVYYELADGRIITAGTFEFQGDSGLDHPRFGFIRTRHARALNR